MHHAGGRCGEQVRARAVLQALSTSRPDFAARQLRTNTDWCRVDRLMVRIRGDPYQESDDHHAGRGKSDARSELVDRWQFDFSKLFALRRGADLSHPHLLAIGGRPHDLGSYVLLSEGEDPYPALLPGIREGHSARHQHGRRQHRRERNLMLASGAKREIVLQDQELLIRHHHKVAETFLKAD